MSVNPDNPSSRESAPERSENVARLLAEASRALARGQLQVAEQILDSALKLSPEAAEAHRLKGIAALIGNNPAKAIEHLRHALSSQSDDPTLNATLGSALIETGENASGLVYLERACQLDPGSASAWYNLGKGLQVSAHMERAREALRRAMAIKPDHLKARTSLASVLSSLGDTAAAVAIYREILGRHPDLASAWFELANLKVEPFSQEDVSQLRTQLGRPGASDDSRILLGFTLAKAMEDQGDYATAFAILRDANALRRRQLHWSRNEEHARVEAIANAFATPLPEPVDTSLGKEVVFVVCLPRSGSTLTEQILATHPDVEGADEIDVLPRILGEESERRGMPFPAWVPAATADDWHRLGKDYLARTERWRQERALFTDKNIDNWAFVGAAMAMLPGARIVNSRRDPLETCLAWYRQLFDVRSIHFGYDLDDIVDYYAGYARLSRLWKQRFPEHYFDHEYEALLADTEGQIRRLLSFCGLPFDPACLAFHETSRTVLTISAAQVRQPLRRDTSRSLKYGDKLAPLRTRLRAAGLLPAER